jgi:copper chaperone CopZ
MVDQAKTYPHLVSHTHATEEIPMGTSTTYGVTGMTCGHCVTAVTEELTRLPGVRDVSVELVAGGTSTVQVSSDHALDTEQVRDAVDEAGYHLAAEAS